MMNAANEEAVALFLNQKIGFTDIFTLVAQTVESFANVVSPSLKEIEETNQSVRASIRDMIF